MRQQVSFLDKGPSRNIPQAVGIYLIVNLGMDPRWVWSLKAITLKTKYPNVFKVRVYSEAAVVKMNFKIKNYSSLSERPEFILFEGKFNKETFQVDIKTFLSSSQPSNLTLTKIKQSSL